VSDLITGQPLALDASEAEHAQRLAAAEDRQAQNDARAMLQSERRAAAVSDPMAPLRAHSQAHIESGNTVAMDGGVASVRSGSVQHPELNGGQPTLIPFIWDGKELNQEEAQKRAIESGIAWPSFASNEAATAASKQLSHSIAPPVDESFLEQAEQFIGAIPENVTKGTYRAWSNTLDLFINRGLRQQMQAQLNQIPGAEDFNDAVNAFFDTSDASPGDVFTQKLAQFFVPFAGYTKLFNAFSRLGPTATGLVADAMTSISALDVHEGRLADLAQELGAENAFIDYLASDAGPDAENRFRNTVDALVPSVAGTALFHAGRVIHRAMRDVDGFPVGPAAQSGKVRGPGAKPGTKAIVASDVKRGAKPKQPIILESKTAAGKQLIDEADEEAAGILAPTFNDFDVRPEVSHQINFDVVETDDDVKAVIAETAARYSGQIDAARRGKITNDQLEALADELHTAPDIIRAVMQRESGQTLTPEMVVASRKVLHDSAQRIQTLANKVRDGAATDIEKLVFRRQMAFHQAYQTQFMGARAEVGRALQAFNIPLGSSETGMQELQTLVETFSRGDIHQVARDIASLDTIGKLTKYTRDLQESKLEGVAREIWINSILSGVKTQIVNMTGNGIFQSMQVAERAVAAQLGKFLPGDDHVLVGEASAHFFGAMSGLRDAFRMSWQTFRHADADMTRLDRPFFRAISSENLELSGWLGRSVDFLGSWVIRFPTERLMASGDEFFKAIAYRGDIARQAYRSASKEGLEGDDFGKHIADVMDSVSPKMQEQAETFALYSTFQLPGGPVTRGFQTFAKKLPFGWAIMPFIRTPGNILKEAGLRSPLAPLMSDFRRAVRQGGPERDMALARLSMGTLTSGLIASMTIDGTITGGGPTNYSAAQALRATGWQPYSIAYEMDGQTHYVSYQRAEPVAMIIGATADAAEIFMHAQYEDELIEDDERVSDLASAVVAGIAQNTLSKSYLSGLSEFFAAASEPDRYLQSWLRRQATGMAPFSALRRDVSRLQDPYVREAWTLADKLQAQAGLPGYSEDLPFKLNVFGEPMEHRSGNVLGVLSPFPASKQKANPVYNEIVRLMDATRRVPVTMPSKKIEGLRLTPRQYHDLITFSRKTGAHGTDFVSAVGSLMNHAEYDALSDDLKVDMIKDLQRKFDQSARRELLAKHPELQQKLLTRGELRMQRKLGY